MKITAKFTFFMTLELVSILWLMYKSAVVKLKCMFLLIIFIKEVDSKTPRKLLSLGRVLKETDGFSVKSIEFCPSTYSSHYENCPSLPITFEAGKRESYL